MKQLEKELETKCCIYARKKGIVSVKIEKVNHNGIPDRIFDDGHKTLWVEFKKNVNEKMKPEQKLYADFFGDRHFLCCDFEMFKIKIDDFFSQK